MSMGYVDHLNRVPSPFGLSRCLKCDTLQELVLVVDIGHADAYGEFTYFPVGQCMKSKCGYAEVL